jgi:hypothetical protein
MKANFAKAIFHISLVVTLDLSGCTSTVNQNEVARITSPDKRFDAVVVESTTDATVSTPFRVVIVPNGQSTDDVNPVYRSDRGSAPSITWSNATTLAVNCAGSRVWHYANFDSIRIGDDFVEINILLQCDGAPTSK